MEAIAVRKQGSTWAFIAADPGFAAAVIGVAEFAFLPKQIAACCDVGGIGPERFFRVVRLMLNRINDLSKNELQLNKPLAARK